MRFYLAFLMLAGCSSNPLPFTNSDGGGPAPSPSPSPVPSPASSCDGLATQVNDYLESHRSCQTAADCTKVTTECGLNGACGDSISSAAAAGLKSLVDAWRARSCGTPCGLDCALLGPPDCVGGSCMLRGSSRVGDACSSDGDCMIGSCATGPSFPGGYCTIRDCNTALQDPCPTGTRCEPVGDGHSYCMQDCCATCNSIQCPRAGYACCGNPQVGGADAVCAPSMSLLCHQEG